MRLFVAICLPEALKSALCEAQEELRSRGVRGSYSAEENLHLTLAFIGEVPDAAPVLDALSEVSFTPFPLTLEGFGRFGDLWWAGLRDSAALAALARRVRRSLAAHQIPFDRKRFSPHITLIRRAGGRVPGLRIPERSMSVEAFSLMRSDRGRSGMLYTELAVFAAREAEQG